MGLIKKRAKNREVCSFNITISFFRFHAVQDISALICIPASVYPYAVLEYLLKSSFPYPFAKVYKVARIKGKPVLKTFYPTEILHIRIPYPLFGQCLISGIFHVFQQKTACHQTDRYAGLTYARIKRTELFFKVLPMGLLYSFRSFLPALFFSISLYCIDPALY